MVRVIKSSTNEDIKTREAMILEYIRIANKKSNLPRKQRDYIEKTVANLVKGKVISIELLTQKQIEFESNNQ